MSGRPSRNPRKPLYNNNNRTGNGGRKNNRSDPRANNIRRKQKSNAMDEEEKSDDVYYVTFKDGPMGLGLDPPPGQNVGSIRPATLKFRRMLKVS